MYIDVLRDGCMPRFINVRGCSKLEGYHCHLNALLSGGNYSPELAGALIALFNYRWNYNCAVRNKGAVDWGMYNHWLLEEMQATCVCMGWPNPCPQWHPAPPTQERFGVDSISSDMWAALVGEGDFEDLLEPLDDEATALEIILEEQRLKTMDAAGNFLGLRHSLGSSWSRYVSRFRCTLFFCLQCNLNVIVFLKCVQRIAWYQCLCFLKHAHKSATLFFSCSSIPSLLRHL
jgi:hypothetical protein